MKITPKRILVLVDSGKGTIANVSNSLLLALRKNTSLNIEVVNLNKKNDDEYFIDEKYSFIYNEDYCNFIFKIIVYCRKIFWLNRIKREFKPDLTISTLISSNLLNTLIGKEYKIGIFHAPINQTKKLGKVKYELIRYSYKLFFPLLDNLFCVSQEVYNDVFNFDEIDKNKIKIVYNVHNKELLDLKSLDSIQSSEEHIFLKDVIIYVGRLDENKNPSLLLNAFIRLVENNPLFDANLVFIGENSENVICQLSFLINKYNLHNRVFILGKKYNPYKYMKRSKVLVSTSYSEGLPGVLIESLLLGVPIIATNSSIGVWEILSCCENYIKDLKYSYHSNNGIIVPNPSSDYSEIELSNALSQILLDSEFYINLKNNPFLFSSKIEGKNVVANYVEKLL